jgi:serine/threonine protein phosphatase PrpC
VGSIKDNLNNLNESKKELQNQQDKRTAFSKAITDAFLSAQNGWATQWEKIRALRRENGASWQGLYDPGTTCSLAIPIGNDLYLAHVGDSTIAVFGEKNDLIYFSEDHTGSNPAEQKRINTFFLNDPTIAENQGWLSFLSSELDEAGTLNGLEPTRTLGDSEHHKIGATSHPEIKIIPLKLISKLLVASDGFWGNLEWCELSRMEPNIQAQTDWIKQHKLNRTITQQFEEDRKIRMATITDIVREYDVQGKKQNFSEYLLQKKLQAEAYRKSFDFKSLTFSNNKKKCVLRKEYTRQPGTIGLSDNTTIIAIEFGSKKK